MSRTSHDHAHGRRTSLRRLTLTGITALLILLCIPTGWAQGSGPGLTYPEARRDSTVNDYSGTKVPAPYQWMEDLNDPALAKWVEEENQLTFSYLDKIPERPWMKQRLTELWNYEKVDVPVIEGSKLFFTKNSGLQNQAVVYEADSLHAEPRMILDPNSLSPDGSVALLGFAPSHDGNYLANALSQGGSDWQSIHVRDLATGKDLADDVQWVKFSGVSWTRDNKGSSIRVIRRPRKARRSATGWRTRRSTITRWVRRRATTS